MKNINRKAPVSDRVSAALALHNATNPNSMLSISALARLAGVNRGNLYSSHKSVIESFRKHVPPAYSKPKPRRAAAYRERTEELHQLKTANKALLLLTGELRSEISRLRRRLEIHVAKPQRASPKR